MAVEVPPGNTRCPHYLEHAQEVAYDKAGPAYLRQQAVAKPVQRQFVEEVQYSQYGKSARAGRHRPGMLASPALPAEPPSNQHVARRPVSQRDPRAVYRHVKKDVQAAQERFLLIRPERWFSAANLALQSAPVLPVLTWKKRPA